MFVITCVALHSWTSETPRQAQVTTRVSQGVSVSIHIVNWSCVFLTFMHLSYHRLVRMICVDFSVDHLVFEAAAVASVFTYWASNFLCPSSWWAIIFSCVGTLLLQGHIGATEASERCLGWPCLSRSAVSCHYITGRRPVSMRVFIALVLETYVCIFRRCMKSDSSDHPSVMFQVPSPWSLVLGLAGLMCQVLVPRSQVQGPWSYYASSLRSHVSGARSQVSGSRF